MSEKTFIFMAHGNVTCGGNPLPMRRATEAIETLIKTKNYIVDRVEVVYDNEDGAVAEIIMVEDEIPYSLASVIGEQDEPLPEHLRAMRLFDAAYLALSQDSSDKIRAIKEVRKQTGWGLRESKNYVEHIMGYHQPDTRRA